VTPEGDLIAIDSQQAVFALIGTVQEEVHRFAISYHRDLRSKRLRYSQLDQIPGVGPKRKELLLKSFHSIAAIRQATLPELERLLPKDTAYAVYDHFHSQDNQEEESCE
jgi:excinuclease ABC subunit C